MSVTKVSLVPTFKNVSSLNLSQSILQPFEMKEREPVLCFYLLSNAFPFSRLWTIHTFWFCMECEEKKVSCKHKWHSHSAIVPSRIYHLVIVLCGCLDFYHNLTYTKFSRKSQIKCNEVMFCVIFACMHLLARWALCKTIK